VFSCRGTVVSVDAVALYFAPSCARRRPTHHGSACGSVGHGASAREPARRHASRGFSIGFARHDGFVSTAGGPRALPSGGSGDLPTWERTRCRASYPAYHRREGQRLDTEAGSPLDGLAEGEGVRVPKLVGRAGGYFVEARRANTHGVGAVERGEATGVTRRSTRVGPGVLGIRLRARSGFGRYTELSNTR